MLFIINIPSTNNSTRGLSLVSLPSSKWKDFQESAVVTDLSLFLAHPYQSTILSYPMPSLNGGGLGLTPYQIDTPAIKTHHKKFQLNPLKNGWVMS